MTSGGMTRTIGKTGSRQASEGFAASCPPPVVDHSTGLAQFPDRSCDFRSRRPKLPAPIFSRWQVAQTKVSPYGRRATSGYRKTV